MRFPIDVIFLDRDMQVVKMVEGLRPWRAASARRARATLELATGEAAGRGIKIGDTLGVVTVDDNADVPEADDHTRVFYVGKDRRFRSAAAALLTRRGYAVTLGERLTDAAVLAERENAEVVVIDAGSSLTVATREAALIQTLDPPVGVVLVRDEREEGLTALPVLAKWGSFEGLYGAIQGVAVPPGTGELQMESVRAGAATAADGLPRGEVGGSDQAPLLRHPVPVATLRAGVRRAGIRQPPPWGRRPRCSVHGRGA